MTWTRLPPIKGHLGGCLNCGPRSSIFPMGSVIAVGFGDAHLSKDGEVIWSELEGLRANPNPTLEELNNLPSFLGSDAEALAIQDPDHDWRIVLNGPLSGRTYQRHGDGQWVLVEQNRGFEE